MTDAVEGAAAAVAVADIAPGAAPDAASLPGGGAAASAVAETPKEAARPRPTVAALAWDGARTIVGALALSFAIRVVMVEPFHIPSASMDPTLIAGDYVGATKYPYGWSRVSASPIPLPDIPGRLFGRVPSRGEIVVFRNDLDGGADYIKRVVGLPGDRVQMRGGILHLNGAAVRTDLIDRFDGVDAYGTPVQVNVYEETLPESCPHHIQHFTYADGRVEGQDYTQEWTVPDGHVFVMGDSRDASYDSRLPGRVGFVAVDDIVGRAEFVFFSMDEEAGLQEGAMGTNLRLDRTLKILTCA